VHDKRLRYPVMNAIMSLMILGAAAGPGLAMAAGETPAFKATRWVNSAPIGAEALRGKVVLVNFWEYTCINWIRTSPYIKAWNRDYAKLGLVVIGVHTPEFEFGKRAENIDRGIRDFGLTYPIAVDNDSAIWYAFGNDAWPATYLFDAQGKLVDRWEGEGSYDEIESEIRRLLLAANPGVKLPETSPEVTAYAKTGDPNYAGITNETYVGTDRRERGAFTLTGSWQSKPQYVELKTGTGKITVPFTGGEVNLVMQPGASGNSAMTVQLDGKPVGAARGADVGPDGVAHVNRSGMFRLVTGAPRTKHLLTLVSSDSGVQAYSFTFGP
jgi:thiol-disulfide isomerase/thioredoxin